MEESELQQRYSERGAKAGADFVLIPGTKGANRGRPCLVGPRQEEVVGPFAV